MKRLLIFLLLFVALVSVSFAVDCSVVNATWNNTLNCCWNNTHCIALNPWTNEVVTCKYIPEEGWKPYFENETGSHICHEMCGATAGDSYNPGCTGIQTDEKGYAFYFNSNLGKYVQATYELVKCSSECGKLQACEQHLNCTSVTNKSFCCGSDVSEEPSLSGRCVTASHPRMRELGYLDCSSSRQAWESELDTFVAKPSEKQGRSTCGFGVLDSVRVS